MNESSKTVSLYSSLISKYLLENVLDIGCGSDPILPSAHCFDTADGNANFIDSYFKPYSFKTVYSSHCLEHMIDPFDALKRWFSIVKIGGYLIFIIPDGDLYEQNIFPSVFNSDHKKIFYVGKESNLPNSVNINELIYSLNGAKLITHQLHDAFYDYSLKFRFKKPLFLLHWRIQKILLTNYKFKIINYLFKNILRFLVKIGVPLDQTLGKAFAQRLVIIKKIF